MSKSIASQQRSVYNVLRVIVIFFKIPPEQKKNYLAVVFIKGLFPTSCMYL